MQVDRELKVTHTMLIGKQVALETYVENFALLAIERLLLADLPSIMTPVMMAGLTDDKVNAMGMRSQKDEDELSSLALQVDVLEKAIGTCRRYATS